MGVRTRKPTLTRDIVYAGMALAVVLAVLLGLWIASVYSEPVPTDL
jgi:hypothetical protein